MQVVCLGGDLRKHRQGIREEKEGDQRDVEEGIALWVSKAQFPSSPRNLVKSVLGIVLRTGNLAIYLPLVTL